MRFNRPPEPEKPEEKVDSANPKIRRKINIKRILLFILILLMVVVSIGLAVNFYMKAQKLESEMQATTVNETQKIVAEVGKLIVLPESEVPTVATISDVEKLRDQPFFANAQNGDKVLIYAKAGKAILYDPIAKIIVEVAPLNVGTSPKSP